MAMIGAALAVSPALAPIIGGYLEVWFGWRAAFVFLSGVGVVVLAATFRLLAETNPAHRRGHLGSPGLVASTTELLRDRRYLGNTIAVSFVFAGLMAFAAGGPFVFIEALGLSPQQYGMLAVFTVVGFLAGSLLAGRLTGRLALTHLVLLGLVIAAAGALATVALAALATPSVLAVVAPMAVFTAGLGIVLPAGMAAAMVPFPRIAGSASALLGFVQMLVAALASAAVGMLPHRSALPMAAVIAACTVLALLGFIILVRPSPRPDPGGA